MKPAASDSEEYMSPEVLVVEKVSHHNIELNWRTVQEDRSGPPENWTLFALEQMDPKKGTYNTIYMGYGTHHIVGCLKPCTSYWFRLRISKPTGKCFLTPAVSASTCNEPLYSKNLHDAVNRNDEEELKRVLQSGMVSVNICDELRLTPLMVAAQKGFSRMVHILLEHGADVHAKNLTGRDAIMLASFAGHLGIVKQLRKFGATWQSQDVVGNTPLHLAVDGDHLPVIAYMIQDGCEVDVRDAGTLWTPLMRVSVLSGNANVASLLIQAGADINVRDKHGSTPLRVAVLNNHEQLVKLLLECGAKDVKNEFGVGIAEIAKSFGNKNIIDLLEQWKIL